MIRLGLIALIAGAATPALAEIGDGRLECGDTPRIACAAETLTHLYDRFGIAPNDDQRKSIRALRTLSVYREKGVEAAIAAFREADLPLFDLAYSLVLAGQDDDARIVVDEAGETLEVFDGAGKPLTGAAALEEVRATAHDWHGKGKDGAYVEWCEASAADFTGETGGAANLRDGACAAPWQPRAVTRLFAMLQFRRDLSSEDAFSAVIEHAMRKGECAPVVAVIRVLPGQSSIASDEESAAWRLLDAMTLCASDALKGKAL